MKFFRNSFSIIPIVVLSCSWAKAGGLGVPDTDFAKNVPNAKDQNTKLGKNVPSTNNKSLSSVSEMSDAEMMDAMNQFNPLTCLPCTLKKCEGSKTIPVSDDICEFAKTGISRTGPVDRDDCFPAWMNLSKFRQGQRFLHEHRGKVGLLETFAMIALLSFPELTDVLLFTSTNECPIKAKKRYLITTSQILLWGDAHIGEAGNPCVVLSSINQVRGVHKQAGKRARRVAKNNASLDEINSKRFKDMKLSDRFWDALKLDFEAAYTEEELTFDPCYLEGQKNSSLLNQFAYAVTQWSFSAISTMAKVRALLGDTSDEDIDAFQHAWAVLGHIMGIDDRFNIALQPNSTAQKKMYAEFTMKYIVPSVYHMNRESKILFELSRMKAFQPEILGVKLPDVIPNEFFGLGFLRLILDIPYTSTYAVSPLVAKLVVDVLDLHVKTGLPPASTLDLGFNLGTDLQLIMWGEKYIGTCYKSWKTKCEMANKLHYWYNGPDINPNGIFTPRDLCKNGPIVSLSCD